MSLMELFRDYHPKPETEIVIGNSGNCQHDTAVTAEGTVKSSGNQSNLGNQENFVNILKIENEDIQEYLIERAAIMEFDGGLTRKDAEQAAINAIRVYCYRVKDKPSSVLTALMPNTELDEAYRQLQNKYGDRLLTVYERPQILSNNTPNLKITKAGSY